MAEIVCCKDAPELASRAARMIAAEARAAADGARGRFLLVLTGGSTPAATYQELASARGDAALPIAATKFFMGDERFVPADDPRSNIGMAKRSLLGPIGAAAENVLAMPTDMPTPQQCADRYERTLKTFFGNDQPRFDVLLLGLGGDGHVASLFPGMATLGEKSRWVVASKPGTLPPPVDRVTMTFPLINAARHVMFLVSGKSKAAPVRDVLELKLPPDERPASAVQPRDGRVTWMLDRDAASLLSPNTLRSRS